MSNDKWLDGRNGKDEEEDTEDRQEQGYSLHIEQEEEDAERRQMHNERDMKDLDKDVEDMPPHETGVDEGEDAEREAGSASLGYRKKKPGTSGEDSRPMR